MAYKIENGKVYEVKEVNVAELEKEVKQVVNFIKQCEANEKPYLNAIASKENEKINYLDKINKEIAAYQLTVDENEKKKKEAIESIIDKKDVISQLYPELNSFLGF